MAKDQPSVENLIGERVFIRTVTHYYTGIAKSIGPRFIELRKAAWIADAGRWSNALQTGTLNEVEPYPDDVSVWVGIGAIVDLCEWTHELPRTQK